MALATQVSAKELDICKSSGSEETNRLDAALASCAGLILSEGGQLFFESLFISQECVTFSQESH